MAAAESYDAIVIGMGQGGRPLAGKLAGAPHAGTVGAAAWARQRAMGATAKE